VPIRRHLTIVPGAGVLKDSIEAMRADWDPVMAAGVPAHVSVVYPEEVTDEQLLLERVRDEVQQLRSFPLDVRDVDGPDAGRGGVFLRVSDRTGALTGLKERLLAAPFRSSGAPFHVTIVHPRTSDRGAAAFAALGRDTLSGSFDVFEICWTETAHERMTVLERFGLTEPRVQVVAAVLRRGDRVLLGHRHPQRKSFPDVWDLPGGHVEPGEHAADAVARELQEELGITALELPATPTIVRSDDTLGVDLSVWVVDHWAGEPTNTAPEEHDALAWCSAGDWTTRRLADPAYLDLLADAVRTV